MNAADRLPALCKSGHDHDAIKRDPALWHELTTPVGVQGDLILANCACRNTLSAPATGDSFVEYCVGNARWSSMVAIEQRALNLVVQLEIESRLRDVSERVAKAHEGYASIQETRLFHELYLLAEYDGLQEEKAHQAFREEHGNAAADRRRAHERLMEGV